MGDMEFIGSLPLSLLAAGSAVIILLGLSALFSSSETAFTAASRARMHQMSVSGNKKASTINALFEHQQGVIASLLIGNNFVNVLASSLATAVMVNLLGQQVGVSAATVMMTILVVVLAEVLPKSWAIRDADATVLKLSTLIRTCFVILGPIAKLLPKPSPVTAAEGTDDSTERAALEEVRNIIELHHHSGDVEKDDRDMLRGILDLRRESVRDVMVHRKNVASLDINADFSDLLAEIHAAQYARVPLYKDDPDNVTGILLTREARRLIRLDPSVNSLEAIASAVQKPWFVPETASLDRQLRVFLKRRSHFAIVIDEYGSVQGVITLSDILEEVFGDIDETDDLHLTNLPDGGIQVDGQTNIRDLNRRMDWNLPEEYATTIAGLVIERTQMLPPVGYSVSCNGYTIDIVERDHNRLTTLNVRIQKQLQ